MFDNHNESFKRRGLGAGKYYYVQFNISYKRDGVDNFGQTLLIFIYH